MLWLIDKILFDESVKYDLRTYEFQKIETDQRDTGSLLVFPGFKEIVRK